MERNEGHFLFFSPNKTCSAFITIAFHSTAVLLENNVELQGQQVINGAKNIHVIQIRSVEMLFFFFFWWLKSQADIVIHLKLDLKPHIA